MMKNITAYSFEILSCIPACIFSHKQCGSVQVTHQQVYVTHNVTRLYLSAEALAALQTGTDMNSKMPRNDPTAADAATGQEGMPRHRWGNTL
jgi:hypothetical protein